MKALEFDLDEIVDLREEEGRIIIEPVRQNSVSAHGKRRSRRSGTST